jgi:hypothetical protein
MVRQETQRLAASADHRDASIFSNAANGLREIGAQQGIGERRLRSDHGAPRRCISGRKAARVKGLDVQHVHPVLVRSG